VIAPARTGNDKSSRITVIITAHTNKGIRSRRIPSHRILMTVVIKFRAPRIEDAPAR